MWGDFCYVVIANAQISEWQLEQFPRQRSQWVITDVQCLQLFEFPNLWGDFCYVVILNDQYSEWQLEQFLRQLRYLVSRHPQFLQLFESEDALGHCSEFVTSNTQQSEIGQLPNAQRQRLQVVILQP